MTAPMHRETIAASYVWLLAARDAIEHARHLVFAAVQTQYGEVDDAKYADLRYYDIELGEVLAALRHAQAELDDIDFDTKGAA